MSDAERQALQPYIDRPLDDLMEELALYDPASRSLGDVWNKVSSPLRRRLCEEWEYCKVKKRRHFDNDVDLAVAVLSVLTASVLVLPIAAGMPLIATIAVKRGLDTLCDCS